MATQFVIAKDPRNVPLWTLDFTDSEHIILLPADTIKTLTVPAGCNVAIFGFGNAQVYVGTETFVLPGSSFSSAAQVKLSPAALNVTAGDTLYFRGRTQTDVGVTFGGAG